MPSPLSPARQLAGFIAKFDPAVAKQIREVRSRVRKQFPSAVELVYDNYNFFVIGYSSTERPSDCFISIAANAKGLTLFFYWGARLPDPNRILQGSGNQVRFVRLPTPDELSKPEVQALLIAAAEGGKVPLAEGSKGKLVIKLIAARQRPRR